MSTVYLLSEKYKRKVQNGMWLRDERCKVQTIVNIIIIGRFLRHTFFASL